MSKNTENYKSNDAVETVKSCLEFIKMNTPMNKDKLNELEEQVMKIIDELISEEKGKK